ncbi:MAG: TonB-dependent receptor [Bacteroidetes bacterium]|nr:TonB-dependent receptor [Bacteroidota bacterium]
MLKKTSITFIILLTAFMGYSQNALNTLVTVDANKLPLETILQNLAAKTNLKFTYDAKQVEKYVITLREKKSFRMEDLLKNMLQQTNLAYMEISNTIVIYPKDAKDKNVLYQTSPNSNSSFASYTIAANIVKGTVMGDNGPLAYATILIKGTNKFATTDANGHFSIDINGSEAILVVSMVGYASKEIKVKTDAEITVQLEPLKQSMDSVVVVGYGSQKKDKIVNAITRVHLDKATSRSVNNVAELLQGKAAGVTIQNEGGDPTSAPRINIRGMGGINGENVLYVIDGAIFSGTPVINPSEIASIDILKDASASIYGARASGGVILITTKKGKSGAASISLDVKYGQQSAWRKLQALNAKQFADVMNIASDNAGLARQDAFNASVYPDGQITRTNWVDAVFQNGKINDYNLNINGGTDKSHYFMSLGYRNQEGILLNTYSKRYNFRINMDQQLKPWLKMGENLAYSFTNGNGANTSSGYTGAILAAIYYPPSVPIYNSTGGFSGLPAQYAGSYGDVINPVAYLKRIDYKNPISNLFFNPYVEIKPMKGLTYRANFAYTKQNVNEKDFTTRILEIGKIFDKNQLNYNISDFTDILSEQTLSYNKSFGDHHIDAVAGYSYEAREWTGLNVFTQNFSDERTIYRYLQNGNDFYKPSSYKMNDALISYFARVNYDYRGKYMLSLIDRYDGSSLVAKQNRFQNYPSISAGWMLSKEEFMRSINWLSSLKLRASYGVLGNLGSLSPSAVSPTLSPTIAYMGSPSAQVFGYAETMLPNPKLTWAKSRQLDYGMDMSIIKNRLSFTADYFIKTTEDMLMLVQTPSTSGVKGQWVNGGTAQDKGIELGIGYNSNPQKEFTYGVNLNVSSIKNKLVSLPNNQQTIVLDANVRSILNPVINQTGYELYSYNVIKTAGIFQTQADINNYVDKNGKIIQPLAKPGDMKFVDANGDGKINNNDRQIVRGAYPDFSYGLSFNAAYKGFDLNIFVQGVKGNHLFNALKYTSLNAGTGQNYNLLTGVLNAWSPTNTGSNLPRISRTDPNGNFGNTSDLYIEDGSYLRVKNLTIGYSLPSKLVSRAKLSSARLYLTSNNLLTFTKYSGFDPEVGMDNYGIDLARYPQARSFLLGINIVF